MRVSIVLASYNDVDHLAGAIRRLLEQRDVDFEIVVVSDGSTDGSADVASRFADGDPRVRAIRLPENVGVALARRRGVEEAGGEFIWFVDSDDGWSDSAASTLLHRADETGADTVFAGATFVEGDRGRRAVPAPSIDGSIGASAALALVLTGAATGHLWNKLFRRSVLLDATFTPSAVHSDLALTLAAVAGSSRVASVPELVYEYRIRPGSLITTARKRAPSLELVDGAAVAAAGAVTPALSSSDELRYFRLRYVVLSGLKDAAVGPYDERERRAIRRRLLGRLGLGDIILLVRKRDVRRLVLAVSARVSLRLHRAVLTRAAG